MGICFGGAWLVMLDKGKVFFVFFICSYAYFTFFLLRSCAEEEEETLPAPFAEGCEVVLVFVLLKNRK